MSESLDHEIRTLQSAYWSERDPDGLAFAPLADAYLRKGDVKEALALLTDGTSRHPECATGHVVATRLYLEQGMHSEAESAARRVLTLDSENIVALSSLARLLYERGEVGEAGELRSTLEALDPESDEARAFAEVVPAAGELPDLAVEAGALEPEIEQGPMDLGTLAPDPEPETAQPVLTRTLGELYVKQGFVEQALHVFRGLLENEPEAEDVLQRVAELERRELGNDRDAGLTAETIGGADEAKVHPDEEVDALARDLAQSGEARPDVDTPFPRAHEEVQESEESVDGGYEIGEYFDDLLAWESK